MSSNNLMNEVVWDKDGNRGCPMSLAIMAAVVVAAVGFTVLGIAGIVALWS